MIAGKAAIWWGTWNKSLWWTKHLIGHRFHAQHIMIIFRFGSSWCGWWQTIICIDPIRVHIDISQIAQIIQKIVVQWKYGIDIPIVVLNVSIRRKRRNKWINKRNLISIQLNRVEFSVNIETYVTSVFPCNYWSVIVIRGKKRRYAHNIISTKMPTCFFALNILRIGG